MNSTVSNLQPLSPNHRTTFPQVPWHLLDIFLGILFAALGIIALNLAAFALAFFWHVPILNNGTALAIFVVVQDFLVVMGAIVFSVLRYRVGLDRLGLRRFDAAFGCLLALGLFFLSFAIRICYVIVMLLLGVKLEPQEVMARLDVTGLNFFLTFFSAAIFAPIAEEIFFRGFMYGGLRARFGSSVGIIVSTLFFTALHFSLDAFVPILVLGLFLAWLYERTGSLYPGILLHATNNAIAVVALLIAQLAGVKLQ